MHRILLVRHGQATIDGDDYDQLSEVGHRQARLLGEHWLGRELRVERVVSGPLRRQVETREGVLRIYREHGRDGFESSTLHELREHEGFVVVSAALAELESEDSPDGDRARRLAAADKLDLSLYFRLYRTITLKWLTGWAPVAAGHAEPWAEFRRRVEAGLARLCEGAAADGRSVVFTSGGPVAVAVGAALRLTDEAVLHLSWIVQNASVSEFMVRDGELVLLRFNGVSHLERDGLITFV